MLSVSEVHMEFSFLKALKISNFFPPTLNKDKAKILMFKILLFKKYSHGIS